VADLDRFCAFAERFLTDERGRRRGQGRRFVPIYTEFCSPRQAGQQP
jgi:hypothetical protein